MRSYNYPSRTLRLIHLFAIQLHGRGLIDNKTLEDYTVGCTIPRHLHAVANHQHYGPATNWQHEPQGVY